VFLSHSSLVYPSSESLVWRLALTRGPTELGRFTFVARTGQLYTALTQAGSLCYIDPPERRGMFEEIFRGKSTEPTAKRDSVMQLRLGACLPRFTLVNARTRISP
jgi:hypothetical protein